MTPKRPTDRLLGWLLWIVDLGRWLAPPSRRREWRRQWRADIRHEWNWLERHPRGVAGPATIAGRTAGALQHAFWLRLHMRHVEMITQDLRYGWRVLARNPGFTAAAVTTLGVALGTNITVFTLMNAVLLRPLAANEPARVVRIVGRAATGTPVSRFSFADFADFRERSTSLTDLSGVNLATFVLTADNSTEQILGEVASGSYVSLRGGRMAAGRPIVEGDDEPGAAPVAIISDALRQRRFPAGESAVGRQVLLNGSPYTIVGIADASFFGSFIGAPVDVWVPIATSGTALGADWRTDRSKRTLALIGRLKPGVDEQRARSELQAVADTLVREFAPADRFRTMEVAPGTLVSGDQRRLARTFLSLLLGLVALVLVVACANIGNLLLVRVLGRRREFAIRVALGASRERLIRMLLTESLLIASAGGAVALLLSLWTSRVFGSIAPLPNLSLRFDLDPDLRVVGFAVLATLAAAAVLAIVGALPSARKDTALALKVDTQSSIGDRASSRLRTALAGVQITVSLVLLIGAGLFVRSARNAEAVDLGFDPRGVLATDIDGAARGASTESGRLMDAVLQRVSALPGVEVAAVSTRAPLDSSTPQTRISAQAPIVPGAEVASTTTGSFLVVSPRYFDLVKTPVVAGRTFTERDNPAGPQLVIVNQTLADRLWPDGDAIGRRLWLDPQVSSSPFTVVGIARNSKYLTIGEESQGHLYLPFAQHPRPGMALLVRARGSLDGLANDVQNTLRAIDPSVQGFFTRTLTDHVGVSLLPVRIAARVATLVAALAVVLALVGLYSLLSFLVAERTHEIGLRRALGAGATEVLRLVMAQGVRLIAAGLAVGIPVALAASRVLSSLLYGVSPTDPLVFSLAATALLAVSVLACCLPAIRAMRVDPLTALRQP